MHTPLSSAARATPVRWLLPLLLALPLAVWISFRPACHAAPAASPTAGGTPREIAVYVYHRPPFFTATSEGQGGAMVEMTLMVLERAGLKPRMITSNFTEILGIFRSGAPFACAPGYYRTDDRKQFARFPTPLYQPLPPVLIVRRTDAGLAASARSIDALLSGGLRVVLSDGYWYGRWLAEALQRTGAAPARSREENVELLRTIADGAHDLTFMGHEEAVHLLRDHADLRGRLVLRPVPGGPAGEPRCLMLGRGVDEATALRIEAAIRELADTPRYLELVQSLRRE